MSLLADLPEALIMKFRAKKPQQRLANWSSRSGRSEATNRIWGGVALRSIARIEPAATLQP